MARAFVKKGDTVRIISGRKTERGKTGKVLRVFPKDQRILVENINLRKKHVRPNPQKNIKGGIIEREIPVHQSNVKVISEE
ncbi:MAG: 50S ribosomal protein L24 [Candidatus Omnitrophica bacterium]|nr:MAG: 50S ribosomal protein L24 [Candidatus Hinthialibacteria bacterium OLB16]MBE7488555.1 50S ribosomal protein L24 [bacterium]MBK7495797.1 50S ribosomal protein L24 [Candidatus Omnitrophota bacterium]MCE7908151.1 50S ribosomal protein L24 [Candidatus Omnitrophica bacterium COP1]MBV6481251.1 50S ribosomal protein L24 [bacterium]